MSTKKKYDLKKPYFAKIKKILLLNKQTHHKETYHIVLDIENSSIQYNIGDSAAIIPKNDPEFLSKFFKFFKNETIYDKRFKENILLKHFLLERANLTKIPKALLKIFFEKASGEDLKLLKSLIENRDKFFEFTKDLDLLDFLERFKNISITEQLFVDSLFRIIPRFYSVSSSQKVNNNEIHLTVVLVSFQKNNVKRFGLCTNFLINLAKENFTNIPLYIHPNPEFSPPDNEKDIIMIGAGTGIAPFLGFLKERYFEKAKGKNWLFFGECYKNSDYYYQNFFEKLEKENFLKITTAFSRDQKEKIYVQSRILDQGKDIYSWIENGAFIYICGDAKNMAKSVENSLIQIFQNVGKMSQDEANLFFRKLRQSKRLLLDVY